MESIKSLMDREHKILGEFLEQADKSRENFNKFKWNLEKHFFVEEKAIFIMNRDMNGEEISDIFELMKEHGEIMKLMKDMEANLGNEEKIDISAIKENLIKHRDFEDVVFYPKLDEILSLEQKQEIMERAREIIR